MPNRRPDAAGLRALGLALLLVVLPSACGGDEVPLGSLDGAEGVRIGSVASAPVDEVPSETSPPVPVAEGPSEGASDESPTEPDPEPEPDAVLRLDFEELSLIDYDIDEILDYLLFPEEYEEGEVELPEHVTKLDGRHVSIVGYMIPGELDGTQVTQFMLVRDLLACCFGGNPMPDEWIDVRMVEGARAEYLQYIPIRVTGVLSVGGSQDDEGYAEGLFQLLAESSARDDS